MFRIIRKSTLHSMFVDFSRYLFSLHLKRIIQQSSKHLVLLERLSLRMDRSPWDVSLLNQIQVGNLFYFRYQDAFHFTHDQVHLTQAHHLAHGSTPSSCWRDSARGRCYSKVISLSF